MISPQRNKKVDDKIFVILVQLYTLYYSSVFVLPLVAPSILDANLHHSVYGGIAV